MDYKVLDYHLDKQQIDIIKDDSNSLMVIAGAGSGKTLTIVGKIKYLILEKKINKEEILCVTFTNAAANSLRDKIKQELGVNIDTYTFHKLALNILKDKYEICDSNLLDDIVHKFFYIDIIDNYDFMNKVLLYFGIKSNNTKKDYNKLLNDKIIILERLLITFIHLFKCNGYNLDKFNSFANDIKKTISYKKYRREKIFLLLALNIYLNYQKYLDNNNEVDFDDLIIKATSYVNNNGYKKIKYIIIDEYQDTSYIRYNLIKSIINKTSAKIMVVGDDFQSIYRFTGCDISLFTNFSNYFDNTKTLKIETTYRNSCELVDIASKFILKNKKQIYKKMISNKHIDKPIEFIKEKNFYQLLDSIDGNILILGRNNNDINKYDISKYNNIKYMTIHKAKGLEEDNVIIVNMSDDILGFPSKIKDDSILRLVTINNDNYPYSEERRLMYVALTRTKNKVYIIVPDNRSIFINELKKIIRKC